MRLAWLLFLLASATLGVIASAMRLWSYLTGKDAVIEYTFTNMTVEVPQTTGANSPRAMWKLNGTLRVRTADRDNPGALGAAARNGTS